MLKTVFLTLLSALIFPSALPAPAAPETVLYDGKAAASAGLTVAPWGAGSGQDSTEVYLFGGHSLKVTTLDLYQGAQIAFAAPVPMNAAEAGRAFQITIRRGAPTLHYDPRTLPGAAVAPTANPAAPGEGGPVSEGPPPGAQYPGGAPGAYPGAQYPGAPGAFPGGQYPGGQYPGGQPPIGTGRHHRRRQPDGTTPDSATVPTDFGIKPTIPEVSKLHLVFTFADGHQADVLRSIPDASDPTVGQGWYSVNVPLSLVKVPAGAALKSVTVGGDQFGVFYVGRIRLATDTGQITASIDAPPIVSPDAPVTLRAKADGGLSALKYSWDFGAAGLPGESVTGSETTTSFSDAGEDYTVTLTVSDVDGIKQPVTATKKIHVAAAPLGQGPFPNGAPGNQN